MEIYKKDLGGKAFFSYLPQFRTTLGEDVSALIQKTIQ